MTTEEPKAPEKGEKKAPEKGEKKAPGKVEKKAPGKVVKKTPGKVEKKAPGKGEKKAPGRGEKRAPGKGEKKAPEKAEKAPEKGDQKAPEKGEKKAPEKGEKAPEKEGKKASKKSSSKFHKPGKPRNYDLGNGVLRFSRTRMYHKKAIYKFIGKKTPRTKRPQKPRVIEKPIGGEKNGGKRFVLVKKRRASYPTQDRIKPRPAKKYFSEHKRHLRKTITPGTILILLAGAHKGKRVVFLKQLNSGLLLVTGPFIINACPLRRISQRYVIATATKLNIQKVKIPDTINDKYFARKREKRAKKEEGDIFQTKKEGYKVTEQRKSDQKTVDKQISSVIGKHPNRKILSAYLSAMWGLRSSQYPHRLKF